MNSEPGNIARFVVVGKMAESAWRTTTALMLVLASRGMISPKEVDFLAEEALQDMEEIERIVGKSFTAPLMDAFAKAKAVAVENWEKK